MALFGKKPGEVYADAVRELEQKAQPAPVPTPAALPPYRVCSDCGVFVAKGYAQRIERTSPGGYASGEVFYYCDAHSKPYDRVEVGADYKFRYYAEFEVIPENGTPKGYVPSELYKESKKRGSR
jgi:hypothetical protein